MKFDISLAARIDGWMTAPELEWLAEAASTCRVIVEVGSWKGRSTKALAMHTTGVVYAVDHWQGSGIDDPDTWVEAATKGADALHAEFLRNLSAELSAKKVIPIRAESGRAVHELRDLLAGRKADMVFIDADHSYDSVKRDILNYRPYVREGGLLSGHDYSFAWPGVIQAVDELEPRKSLAGETSIWYIRRHA